MKSHEKKGREKGGSYSKNGPQTFKPTFQRFLKACHPAITSNPGTLLSSSVAGREKLWQPQGEVSLVQLPPLKEEETEAQRGVATCPGLGWIPVASMECEGKGVEGDTWGSAASPLLARSLTALGLSFPTEKGKKRVLQHLK